MLGHLMRTWLRPLALILALVLTVFAIGSGLDVILSDASSPPALYEKVLPADVDDARSLLTSLMEFLAGLVGLGITVATILVQLSANRYSSRVADLFVADRANLAFFSLAIVTPLYTFWVVNLLDSLPWPTSHAFLVLVLVSLNMLLLIPYVNHLFSLLKPEEIITRIRRSVDLSRLNPKIGNQDVDRARRNLVVSLNQLTDVILNSINNSDLNLALRSVIALRSVVVECIRFKNRAPERWFLVPEEVFMGPVPQQLSRGPSHRCWVEYHAMKQYEQVFFQAVQRYPEVTSAIVARTREIGCAAHEVGDVDSVEATILFFNTYLRHSMNARDIRTIFHTFHQYRLLAEATLPGCSLDMATRLAEHFRYYGQQCEGKGLGFAIEIAAYDLRRLMEVAFEVRRDAVDRMLDVFLEIDREPDDEAVETGQRGVRKSQCILAAVCLQRGEDALARRIQDDMSEERRERLRSIRDELKASTSEEFWEIQARGAYFYYVPENLRPHLHTYFSWFGL